MSVFLHSCCHGKEMKLKNDGKQMGKKMKKRMNVVLFGNPNVGKSVIFSRLTGVFVVASNYPGTTVEYTKGKIRINGRIANLIDAPGTYSLKATNKAEEVAVKILKDADAIVNIVDATHLERNLFLTLQILSLGKPVIVALNMWDDTKHKGIKIDVEKLEKELGVPVIPTVGRSGYGLRKLQKCILKAKKGKMKRMKDAAIWKKVGEIIKKVQKIEHKHHTLSEIIADATVKPETGLPIAIFVLASFFIIVINVGNWLIENIIDPFFYNIYGPHIINMVSSVVPEGVLREILIGQFIEGEIDFSQSFGLLTTGVYVPIGMVMPFLVVFYLALSFVEDVGYLPRLAVLLDNIMHRLGVHGHSIIPLILAAGCNVPGILATRIIESKRQRFILIVLMTITIPCFAQFSVILSVLSNYGLKYIMIVLTTLFFTFLCTGFILHRVTGGEIPEFVLEIPPYRIPDPKVLLSKTYMRMMWFLKDAVPFVFLGVLIANILYILGVIEFLGNLLAPVLEWWFGIPRGAILALLIGILRKDVASAMLLPLGMDPIEMTIAVTVMTLYFPCIATFIIMFKELGIKHTLKGVTVMILISLIVGGALNVVLSLLTDMGMV